MVCINCNLVLGLDDRIGNFEVQWSSTVISANFQLIRSHVNTDSMVNSFVRSAKTLMLYLLTWKPRTHRFIVLMQMIQR